MEQSKNNYQKFQQQKNEVEGLLSAGVKIFSILNMSGEEKKSKQLEEKVKLDTFKVMVLGRFKTGKSTFINALLGEDILPAYAVPCTAVINEVKYGEKRRAVLYFKDPLPERISEKISPATVRCLQENKGRSPAPMEIPVNRLEEFVTIAEPEKEQGESVAETPYRKVELFWDLYLCKDGIEIIDSPGLDESSTRTNITVNYLSNADAILFVMSCPSLCSTMEMDFIDNYIKSSGHEYIFFVNNRFNQIPEKHRSDLVRYGNSKLSFRTKLGAKGIFYMNALGALEGRMNNDADQLVQSGILPLEELLADFLVNHKGKVKILGPVKELSLSVKKALYEVIPMQRGLLDTSLEEIKKRYESQKPALEKLEEQKMQIIEDIQNRIALSGLEIESEIDNNFSYIMNNAQAWINEIVVKNEFKTFNPKESAKAIITELLDKFQTRMEKEQTKWTKEKLTPLIESKMQEIFADQEGNIERFFGDLAEIKIRLSGINPEEAGIEDKSTAERIGASIVGLFVDAGSAWYGYHFGFSRGFYQQLAVQLGAIITMLLLGITNPLTMLPVILVIALAGVFNAKERIIGQIKKSIGSKIREELEKRKRDTVEGMSANIISKMHESSASIQGALENEIAAVRVQVEQIIKDKEANMQAINQKKGLLDECEAGLKRMDQELNDITLDLAGAAVI